MKKLLIPVVAGLAALFAAPVAAFADGGLNPIPMPAPTKKPRPNGAIGPPLWGKMFLVPNRKKKSR